MNWLGLAVLVHNRFGQFLIYLLMQIRLLEPLEFDDKRLNNDHFNASLETQ